MSALEDYLAVAQEQLKVGYALVEPQLSLALGYLYQFLLVLWKSAPLSMSDFKQRLNQVQADPLSTFLTVMTIYLAVYSVYAFFKGLFGWIKWALKLVLWSAIVTGVLYLYTNANLKKILSGRDEL